MRIVSVAGSQSNVGKTSVAVFLLRHLPGYGALKVTVCSGQCPRQNPCGVCSRLSSPFSIIEDEFVIRAPHTDTALLSTAGASKVIWLQSREDGLSDGIKLALSRFSNLPGIVTEGNHFIKAVKPLVSLLVLPDYQAQLKPSAIEILDRVDVAVINLRRDKNPAESSLPATPDVLPVQLREKPIYFIAPQQDDWAGNEIFLSYIRGKFLFCKGG